MDDLGSAMSEGNMLMLGGGNPAHIPEVQQRFRDDMESILREPSAFERMVGNYDGTRGNAAFIEALVELMNDSFGWGIEIFGTKARLKGGEFVYRSSGADILVINHGDDLSERICFEDHEGHLGGDEGLICDLHERMVDWPLEDVQAELRQVVHGHQMAFIAEDARRTGAVVKLPSPG